jgi:hypothetical protein
MKQPNVDVRRVGVDAPQYRCQHRGHGCVRCANQEAALTLAPACEPNGLMLDARTRPLWVKSGTFAAQKAMSALPPKADMCGAISDVRFGPIAGMSSPIGSARWQRFAAGVK